MSEFRLNRVCSRPITQVLLKTSLSPNQITLLSLAFGLTAGFLFSRGEYVHSLAAAGSYQLAAVLDNCDGEVARAKNMRSKIGGWLDMAADILSDTALFTGIAVGMKRMGTPGPVDLFWVLCLSGAFLHFLLVVAEKIKGFGPAVFEAHHPESQKRKDPFLDIFDAFREGDASWFVVLFAVFGQTQALLWTGGIYMQVLWLSALLINFRWTFGSRSA